MLATIKPFAGKMILDKELLKRYWDGEVKSKNLRRLNLENPGLEHCLEKKLIHKVFCVIFLISNKIMLLLHLSSGIYVKDPLRKAWKIWRSIQKSTQKHFSRVEINLI